MADRNLEADCGLYCGSCPVRLKQFDSWLVQAILKHFECAEADLDCRGCRAETISLSCRDCDRRDCAQSNGFDSCSACLEMPCERMRGYLLPHMSEAVPNLEALRERGSEAWLAEQTKHWSCATCGVIVAWDERTCLRCDAPVPSGHEPPEGAKDRPGR
jgi:hypothetical protein